MSTTLEKENLYNLIAAIIGDDATLKVYRHGFNENTVEIVENMLSADSKCNKNMKKLVMNISKSGSIATKGWLKKLLKVNSKALKKINLKGYGCQVSVKSRWKTAVTNSAI